MTEQVFIGFALGGAAGFIGREVQMLFQEREYAKALLVFVIWLIVMAALIVNILR